MATVRIPPVLRPKTGGSPEVEASGSNVGEVLRSLTAAHPDTSAQLFDAETTGLFSLTEASFSR